MLAIHNYILKYIENPPDPSPLLNEKVEKGDPGCKTGKGFQEWSPDDILESIKRLQEYLVKVGKE